MKFLPVPGTGVLFCVCETRVQDYDAFVKATKRPWPKPSFEQGPTHPAVNVSWDDAKAFCCWLTEKERAEEKLASQQEYRLPKEAEWSVAVGLGQEPGKTPQERDGKIKGQYPWGSQWPPPRGVGNCAPSLKADDFDYTSPMGRFAANRYGLYDLSGNVWEWCEDYYDGKSGGRVLRGESWFTIAREINESPYPCCQKRPELPAGRLRLNFCWIFARKKLARQNPIGTAQGCWRCIRHCRLQNENYIYIGAIKIYSAPLLRREHLNLGERFVQDINRAIQTQ
jgi:hypothetical protein